MPTSSSSASTQSRSRSVPFTVATTAALARPRPIAAARSPAVVPVATSREEPSGSRIVIWSDIFRRVVPTLPPSGTGSQHLSGRSAGLLGHVDVAVGARDASRVRGQRLRLLGGVAVDVVLARQVADRVHDLVHELA